MLMDPLARWIDPKQSAYYLHKDKGLCYIVGPNQGEGHYVGNPKGWKFDLNKFNPGFMGSNVQGAFGYQVIFDSPDLVAVREYAVSFERYMDRLNMEAAEAKAIGFIFNESKTQSKGLQAYLYAFPVPSKYVDEYNKVDLNKFVLDCPVLDNYVKWHSEKREAIAKGQWGQACTDTLKIQSLLTEKHFKFLPLSIVKDLIGEDAVIHVYKWFKVDASHVKSKPPNRFNNLL